MATSSRTVLELHPGQVVKSRRQLHLDVDALQSVWTSSSAPNQDRWIIFDSTETDCPEPIREIAEIVTRSFNLDRRYLNRSKVRVGLPSDTPSASNRLSCPPAECLTLHRVVAVLNSREITRGTLNQGSLSTDLEILHGANEALCLTFGVGSSLELSWSENTKLQYQPRVNGRTFRSKPLDGRFRAKRVVVVVDFYTENEKALLEGASTLGLTNKQLAVVRAQLNRLTESTA